MDKPGTNALNALELLGVETELKQVFRSGGPCELCLDRLVAAVGLALEEVRYAAPSAVNKVSLVDDIVSAGSDGLFPFGRTPSGSPMW